MNNKVNMAIEVKNGKTYEVTRVVEDRAEVYESLARDVVDKVTNVWYTIITENILTLQPICDIIS